MTTQNTFYSPQNKDFFIPLENYLQYVENVPKTGKYVIGYEQNDYIVFYQAYKNSIANFAVANQKLGGNDFSYERMSWIKPNFLWMMFRCGWAEKENQERVLAFWIKKIDFLDILKQSVFTHFDSNMYADEETWKNLLTTHKVRLQWDPDHNPTGGKLERKAMQLGLKGKILEKFGQEYIQHIADMTDFVKSQKPFIQKLNQYQLLVPQERIISIDSPEICQQIGLLGINEK